MPSLLLHRPNSARLPLWGFVLLACLTLGVCALAESPSESSGIDPAHNWPQWRGPLHTGVAPHANPPLEWNESEDGSSNNILWKVPIAGNGLASPIVWGDRIYLLTAVAASDEAYQASRDAAAEKLAKKEWPPSVEPVKQRFVVLALSTKDGSVIWERTAAEGVPHESHYIDSSWASASPLVDGKRLYAHFGSNGLFAYDLTGKLLWKRELGKMRTRRGFGEGSSPTIDIETDTLVVNWDHEDESFLVALDAATGKTRWKVEREGEVTSWATPLIVEAAILQADGSSKPGKQVIVPGTGQSRGYDLATGKELWSLSGMTVNAIPSPVAKDDWVYLASGYRGNMLQAVDLSKASGELDPTVKGPALKWFHEKHTPYVPSVLLYDEQLYFVKHFRNIFTSLDANDGTIHFTEKRVEPINNVYASPLGAAGRVYVMGRKGKTVVLKHGKSFEVLATNELQDDVDATPAAVGNRLYVRGRAYLYAIGER